MDPAEHAQLRSDAATLAEMTHSQYWDVFVHYLDQMAEAWKDRTMTGSKEDFEYNKGVYAGLRDARNIPGSVRMMAEGGK